jgi:hypothetical protein
MLCLNLYSWELDKRDEIIKGRLENGRMTEDGKCDMQDWLLFGGNWGQTDCPLGRV